MPGKSTETNAVRTCGSPQSQFSLWQWTCTEWPSPPPWGLRAAPSTGAAPTPRKSTPEAVLSATPSLLLAGGRGRASRAAGPSPHVWFPQAPPSPQVTSRSASERRHAPPAWELSRPRGTSRELDQWAGLQPPPACVCTHLYRSLRWTWGFVGPSGSGLRRATGRPLCGRGWGCPGAAREADSSEPQEWGHTAGCSLR